MIARSGIDLLEWCVVVGSKKLTRLVERLVSLDVIGWPITGHSRTPSKITDSTVMFEEFQAVTLNWAPEYHRQCGDVRGVTGASPQLGPTMSKDIYTFGVYHCSYSSLALYLT